MVAYKVTSRVIHTFTFVLLSMLVLCGIANAEFYVCGNATKFDQSFYRDPSLTRPSNCSLVPDNLVTTQVNLIVSVPSKYLKVTPAAPNGLAVEMTAQEKQAVDDAQAALDQARAALRNELTNNQACANTSLAQIETYLDNRMATITTAINNIPTTTISGTVVITAAATKTALQNMINEVDNRDRAILRCLLARSLR